MSKLTAEEVEVGLVDAADDMHMANQLNAAESFIVGFIVTDEAFDALSRGVKVPGVPSTTRTLATPHGPVLVFREHR